MNHAQEKLTEKEQKSFIQSIKDFFNNMIKSLKDYMESYSRRFSRSEYLKASKQLEKIRDDALAAWDKAIENRKREMSGENSKTAKADKKAYSLNPNPDTKVEVDKEGIVIITGSRYSVSQVTKDFRNVAKNIRSELSKLVGNSYVIKADNREVHIGADFVGEYSGSKDTQKSRKDVKRTKANAIPRIEKIIENADNPKYLQNDEEKHNNDARRGWTRYDVTFGLSDGSVVNYFRGFLNIRMAADGKDYVYDITKINKLKNGPHIRQATNNSAYDNSGIHKENISSNKENVNKRYSLNVDTEGNELSDQQQEYFKDSKVRDENGNLKPVYHGTGSQFNVFSYDFIGKTGSAEGYGFYFTDQIEKAKRHSNSMITAKLDKFASYHLNAYREFRKLSGYKDDSVLMSIYDELERGQQKKREIQRHVNDAFLGLLQSNRKEVMKLESYKPEDLVDIGLKDENGEPVMVTRAMRLSVIMHSYNKGNMNHVLNEGFTIPDIKLYEKGKVKEAWEKAKTYRCDGYYKFFG